MSMNLHRWACVICLLWAGPAWATVFQYGDVTPADNPATVGSEGIIDFIARQSDPDDYETDAAIVIGQDYYGLVRITAGSEIRYQDLVLGGVDPSADDMGMSPDIFEGSAYGTGILLLEGFGTLFNNDIELDGPFAPADTTPRLNGGFNTYIGLTGTGLAQVSAGARMELGSALIVGLAAGSHGELLVDGFSSHINVAGRERSGTGSGDNDFEGMLVGPLGTGIVTIQNGAQVDARAGAALGALTELGGTMGGGVVLTPTEFGGNGTVTVTGLGSAWRIKGGLAVGVVLANGATAFDYSNQLGQGTLNIDTNAIVAVTNRVEGDDPPVGVPTDLTARMSIGRFGTVNLTAGRLVVDGPVNNHGIIQGAGIIETGTFLNAKSNGAGDVLVGEGQKLTIKSRGVTPTTFGGEMFWGASTGLIEVDGGEFEFDRARDDSEADTRFKNLFVAAQPDDPTTTNVDESVPEQDGTISVRDGIVRFRSGLTNTGTIGFTAGDNLLSGDVINGVGGRILFSGDSNTTFDSDFANGGEIKLSQDSTLSVLGDLSLLPSAALTLTLASEEVASSLPQGYLASAGDIDLGGLLTIEAPASLNFNPLPGDSFLLMSAVGAINGSFDALDFSDITPLANPGWNWTLNNTGDDLYLAVSDIVAIGADFNGDGIVDAADIDIWRMFFGLDMGATSLMGDADGDGDVDAADYFEIISQLGGPGMPGALAPGGGTVPEPSTALLVLAAMSLGAVTRRRS